MIQFKLRDLAKFFALPPPTFQHVNSKQLRAFSPYACIVYLPFREAEEAQRILQGPLVQAVHNFVTDVAKFLYPDFLLFYRLRFLNE